MVFAFGYIWYGLFIFICVWSFHLGMVYTLYIWLFHLGVVFSFRYGLLIWVWCFHLGMVFSFRYGVFIWVWSFRSFVSVSELIDSLCRDDVDTPIA